jgi:hypothetical protein
MDRTTEYRRALDHQNKARRAAGRFMVASIEAGIIPGFSRKPEPAASTTWHAEDFQPAPEPPAVADPWAPDAA